MNNWRRHLFARRRALLDAYIEIANPPAGTEDAEPIQ